MDRSQLLFSAAGGEGGRSEVSEGQMQKWVRSLQLGCNTEPKQTPQDPWLHLSLQGRAALSGTGSKGGVAFVVFLWRFKGKGREG